LLSTLCSEHEDSSKLHSTKSNKPNRTSLAAATPKAIPIDSIFPHLENDVGSTEVETSDTMRKDDPLAIQIWKLYSKAKTQLLNAEHMENLAWRTMAMRMRRAELGREKGCIMRHAVIVDSCSMRVRSANLMLIFPL
jgi:hypothetical protein